MCARLRAVGAFAVIALSSVGFAHAGDSGARATQSLEPAAAVSESNAGLGNKDRSLAAELVAINERIALLSARLKELELGSQIAEKARAASAFDGEAAPGYSGSLPVVRGIDGMGRRLRATLAWGGGIVSSVAEGDALPGGWRVKRIDLDTVELTRGTEHARLAFGTEPPAAPNASASQRATAPAFLRP